MYILLRLAIVFTGHSSSSIHSFRWVFIFQASKGISDLSHIKSVTAAKAGEKGRNKNMHGKDADHKVVEVPVGTVFRNLVENLFFLFRWIWPDILVIFQEREIVCELTEEGSMFLAAKGGAGGKGNAFFK